LIVATAHTHTHNETSTVHGVDHREPSVTGLVSGIMDDAQRLAEQQFALLRQEIKQEISETLAAAQSFAAGGIVGFIAGIALMAAASLGLYAAVPSLPLWGAFAIVGLIFAAVSAALVFAGKKKISSIKAIPLTLQTSKENLQCLTPARK